MRMHDTYMHTCIHTWHIHTYLQGFGGDGTAEILAIHGDSVMRMHAIELLAFEKVEESQSEGSTLHANDITAKVSAVLSNEHLAA